MMQKVYIIEDDSMFAMLIAEKLRTMPGVEVECFPSGEAMFVCLSEYDKPDAMIVDFKLNSRNIEAMSGADVLNKLKTLGFNIPVVLMSSLSWESLSTKIKNLGVRDLVLKSETSVTLIYSYMQSILKSNTFIDKDGFISRSDCMLFKTLLWSFLLGSMLVFVCLSLFQFLE